MQRALAITFLLIGVLMSAAEIHHLTTNGYRFGTEVLLIALMLATGISAALDAAGSRTLALAWFRAGSLCLFVVPAMMLVWIMVQLGEATGWLGAIGMLAIGLFAFGDGLSMLHITGFQLAFGALVVLTATSYVCLRLYKRVAARTPSPRDRRRATLLAVVIILLALAMPKRFPSSESTHRPVLPDGTTTISI